MKNTELGQGAALRARFRARATCALVAAGASGAIGCSTSGSAPAAATCDQRCQDGVALRALRDVMKFAFNNVLQGNDAGAQDETSPCEYGVGSADIRGDATSNAQQGATEVHLTYVFHGCLARQTEATPELNYNLSLNGTITEDGTLSAVSTSTMALNLGTVDAGATPGLSFAGTVYDPAIDYRQAACPVVAVQNGNNVSGTICGRETGFTF
jgi:hypothetical protein